MSDQKQDPQSKLKLHYSPEVRRPQTEKEGSPKSDKAKSWNTVQRKDNDWSSIIGKSYHKENPPSKIMIGSTSLTVSRLSFNHEKSPGSRLKSRSRASNLFSNKVKDAHSTLVEDEIKLWFK